MQKVFRHETGKSFTTPVGYVFIGVYALITGIMCISVNIMQKSSSSINLLFSAMYLPSLLLCPVITMGLFAEEKRSGTLQLLLTSPLKVWQIVVGKAFSAYLLMGIAMVCPFVCQLILSFFAGFSFFTVGFLTQSLTSFLGYFMLNVSLLSMGVMISSFCENQITAAVATLCGNLFIYAGEFYIIPRLSSSSILARVLQLLPSSSKITGFGSGIISPSSIMYFIIFSCLMLYFTCKRVSGYSKKGSFASHKLQRIVSLITGLVILLCGISANELLSLLENKYYLKLDVSSSGVSQLSDYTKSVLSSLDTHLTVYQICSNGYEDDVTQLVDETLKRMAAQSPNIDVKTLDPSRDTEQMRIIAGMGQVENGTVFVVKDASENQGKTRCIRIEKGDFLFSKKIQDDIYTIYSGEAQLTGAIRRLTMEKPVELMLVSSHGEMNEDEMENFILTLRSLGIDTYSSALTEENISADTIIAIISPKTDISLNEAHIIADFADNGGKVVIGVNSSTEFEAMENLKQLAYLYGITFVPGLVEADRQDTTHFVDDTFSIIPTTGEKYSNLIDTKKERMVMSHCCSLEKWQYRPEMTGESVFSLSSGRDICQIAENSAGGKVMAVCSTDVFSDSSSYADASSNIEKMALLFEKMVDRGIAATLDAGVRQLPSTQLVFNDERQKNIACAVIIGAVPAGIIIAMAVVLIIRRRKHSR